MADFQPIPINGTAEQLEKLLRMDIVESITENSTDDQIPTALAVKNAIASGGGGSAESAVLYTAQNPTLEQKAQARRNIGAARGGEDYVVIGSEGSEESLSTKVEIYAATPEADEDDYITAGRVVFYAVDDDQPVILGHLADGINDDDAATVGQVKEAAENVALEILLDLGLIPALADADGAVLAESSGAILINL